MARVDIDDATREAEVRNVVLGVELEDEDDLEPFRFDAHIPRA